ncbi:MAG: alpha/beta hydrolase [Friedmanniella sp.]|jgi:pimeloyl-ACP methyl ester carboxylesterase|nr:alpha/beta hydrolase [Friedmanniella sp.]
MVTVHHRHATIDGRTVAYREAGGENLRQVLLLHGAPASSFMFRELIPLLAKSYHVLAPDYLGFGLSDAPPVDELDYTFDHLTDSIAGLLREVGFDDFTVYAQDYGAPVAWRLALRDPTQIAGLVVQNANAYDEGFVADHWQPLWRYAEDPTPENAAPLRAGLTEQGIRWQYENGVADTTLVSPDAWMHDLATASRPGNHAIQLALYRDYPSNVALYPAVQDYFRTQRPPTLIVWGEGDGIFTTEGAEAFRRDLPDAELHLRPGGHFLLETDLDHTSAVIIEFLARVWDEPERSGRTTAEELVPVSSLPHVVTEYLARSQGDTPGTAKELLTATATITDDGTLYDDDRAITDFLEHASTEFDYTSTLVGARRRGTLYTAVNQLDGNFPGGRAVLQYKFALTDDRRAIDELRIEF